jgi:hypothetical protein
LPLPYQLNSPWIIIIKSTIKGREIERVDGMSIREEAETNINNTNE